MNLRGLFFIFLCFHVSAQEPESEIGLSTAAFAEVARLAKTDTKAAITLLRDSKNLEPDGIYQAFSHLETAEHFQLLHEICKDEELANRFVFTWLSLIPKARIAALGPEAKNLDPKELFVLLNNEEILPLLKAAPETMPPVLAVPALGSTARTNKFVLAMVMAFNEQDSGSEEAVVELFSQEISTVDTPERFKEILTLISALGLVEIDNMLSTNLASPQTSHARIATLLEESNIPVSVRLGFVGMGDNSRKSRSDETVVKTGQWLAEALEQKIPVDTSETEKLLKRFVEAHRHPDWKTNAIRILNASSELNSKNDKSHPWLVGIAAVLDDRNFILKLAADRVDSQRDLAVDPSFFLLIREGFFDLANQQIKEKNRELLLTRSTDFFRGDRIFKAVLFDQELESNVAKFTKTIANTDVRFIAELHLKILPDDPDFPPQISHADRLRELALQLKTIEFQEPTAKYTALRMLGHYPEVAAVIWDVYVDYAQFDRIDKNLNHIFSGDAWSKIAVNALSAVLAAEKYEDAVAILEKIAHSTATLGRDRNVFLDEHNELWEKILKAVSKEMLKEQSSPDLLPIARLLNHLPRQHFSPLFNYSLGDFSKTTLWCHAKHNQMEAWWKWYESMPSTSRKSHDTILINHITGRDKIGEGPASWSDEPKFEPTYEGEPYTSLIQIFRKIPYRQPTETRIAAAIRAMNPDTPAAIAVLHNYRYLSAEEILANATELASALPVDASRKWSDLTLIAREAGKTNLAREFSEKAK